MTNQKRWLLPLICLVLLGGALVAYKQIPRIRLQGIYYRTGEPTPGLQRIEITRDRFIMHVNGAGALASDYAVENGRIYVGSQPSQFYFTIDGLGVISNQGNMGMEGTYLLQK
ncbi:hypothetical protein [Hymenobacter cheonanensis]|uniref:hypothetical protein n=1 Tax=Hymenobacter sp. CA2-7 TaxID=3063993 RepID=UPI00271413AD|nr:hypothetical protein [Hymenobacter sp. CA2-7]MDO7884240.1 hypothetical protein [Hymenobacter sp. CA2-7]